MKNSSTSVLLMLLSLLAVPLLIGACEKEEGKCTEETLATEQSIITFHHIAENNATVNPDGTIFYDFKFAYLEVCTYSPMSLVAHVDFIGSPVYEALEIHTEIKMYDVYDRLIFDWTLMSQNESRFFNYQDSRITLQPQEQETIIWVEIRVVVPPGSTSVADIHDYMENGMLIEMGATLTRHRPNY